MRVSYPQTPVAFEPTVGYRLSVIAAAICAGAFVHLAFADYDLVVNGPPANAALLMDLISAPSMVIGA